MTLSPVFPHSLSLAKFMGINGVSYLSSSLDSTLRGPMSYSYLYAQHSADGCPLMSEFESGNHLVH